MKNWNRKYFQKPGENAFLFYVVFGNSIVDFNISSSKYRTDETPEEIELFHLDKVRHAENIGFYLSGYPWEELKKMKPAFADQIENATECYVIQGEVRDSDNLNYFRDVIGLVTYLLDNGGVTVYDPQMMRFWEKADWMEKVFNPNNPLPRNHVMILFSDEENDKTKWFHTRGMRKFGRPDISIHNVPSDKETVIVGLINSLIELLAYGKLMNDGQEITFEGLPTMWCENKGDFDDPDFNNRHLEIHWD